MVNRSTSTNFFAPRRQERKEIQKSPFHPPLTKGERGGFEEPWRPLRLYASHRFSDSVIQNSTENFKYLWLALSCQTLNGVLNRCSCSWFDKLTTLSKVDEWLVFVNEHDLNGPHGFALKVFIVALCGREDKKADRQQ